MNEFPWAMDVIKALGAAGGPVFAVLWWLERIERRTCQKETKEQLTQVLTVASQAATSVTEVTKAVSALGAGSRDEVISLQQLGQLINTLSMQLLKAR